MTKMRKRAPKTQVAATASLILVIFTCLVIGIIAGSAIGISYHHNKTQDLRSRIAEAEATINIKDRELVRYEEQLQQLKQEAKQ